MRTLMRRWPTAIALLFFALNVDFVLMPAATSLGMPGGWPLFWFAAFFATAEPVYWNWYAKWLVRSVVRSDRAAHVRRAYASDGIADQLRAFVDAKFDWFVEHARIHASGDGAGREFRESAAALIRGTHVVITYPMMLALGFTPSGWPVAIFIQRIFPVPGGFVLFLAANAVKTYALGLAFLWLPWWGKSLVVICAVLLVTTGTRSIVAHVSRLSRSFNGLP